MKRLVLAGLIAAAYLTLAALGGRDLVGILSGTLPASEHDALAGVAYVLAWFGITIIAPILVGSTLIDRVVFRTCGTLAARLRTWTGTPRP